MDHVQAMRSEAFSGGRRRSRASDLLPLLAALVLSAGVLAFLAPPAGAVAIGRGSRPAPGSTPPRPALRPSAPRVRPSPPSLGAIEARIAAAHPDGLPARLTSMAAPALAGATTIAVDTTADLSATSVEAAAAACAAGNHGTCSLREAVMVADSLSTPAVVSLPGGEYLLSKGTISLDDPNGLTLMGAGATSTVVGVVEGLLPSVVPGPSGAATGVYVGLSDSTAGTTSTYQVFLTPSVAGALAPGDTVDLSAPPGTVFPASGADYTVTDDFLDATLPSPSHVTVSAAGSSVAIPVTEAVPAGDTLDVEVSDVANPASPGTERLSVSTSADPTPVMSLPYDVTAASGQVSDVAVFPQSNTEGATTVYDVYFVTSSTGGFAASTPASLTFSAPAGTAFSSTTSDYAVDAIHPSPVPSTVDSVKVSGSSVVVTFTPSGPIAADSSVLLSISDGVRNPTTVAELDQASVSTSADPTPTVSSPYSIVGQTQVPVFSVATGSGAGLTTVSGVALEDGQQQGDLEAGSGPTELAADIVGQGVSSADGGGVSSNAALYLSSDSFNADSAMTYGGALYAGSHASVLASDVAVDAGLASDGGAIYNDGTFSASGLSSVASSTDDGLGGAIYNDGALDLSGGTLSSNGVTLGAYLTADGGALYNADAATLTDVAVEGNVASDSGGGVYDEGESFSMTGGSLTGNGFIPTYTDYTYYGGGLYGEGYSESLSGVTVADNFAYYYGGGIYNDSTQFSMTGGSLSGNASDEYGGGLYAEGTSTTLSSVAVTKNFAYYYGGGIYNDSTQFSMTGGSLSDNSAPDDYGGGLYAEGDVASLSGVDVTGNTSYDAGGIYNDSTQFSMTGGSLSDNSASGGYGGGLYNDDVASLSGVDVTGNTTGNVAFSSGGGLYSDYVLTVFQSSISANVAAYGAGIYNGDVLSLSSSTLSANVGNLSSGDFGAGLYTDGTATLVNDTVAGNTVSVGSGAGLYNNKVLSATNLTVSDNVVESAGPLTPSVDAAGGLDNEDQATVVGTILAGDTVAGANQECSLSGMPVSGGFDLTSDDSCGLSGTGNLVDTDPLLEPLGNYGGPTATEAIPPSSPAIGADAACPPPATDQRGVPRPPRACDIGAFQYVAPAPGYDLAGSDGGVFSFGAAAFLGSGSGMATAPVVGVALTPDAGGYWLAAANGAVLAFGDARSFGSLLGTHLASPVVGIAASPDARGYWLVAADGAVYPFGSARSFGSLAGMHLNAPVVGIAAAPDGMGYWLAAADGGVFAFGSAHFFGSTGSMHLNAPVVGIAAAPDGMGYWLAAADGGVFAFGSAHFFGSVPGALAAECVAHGFMPGCAQYTLAKPVVGIAAAPDGMGYWLAAADGGVFAFGSSPFEGSVPGALAAECVAHGFMPGCAQYTLAKPVVGIAGQ
jgi:hypothetical protein